MFGVHGVDTVNVQMQPFIVQPSIAFSFIS
jgi:hypothetical protein